MDKIKKQLEDVKLNVLHGTLQDENTLA